MLKPETERIIAWVYKIKDSVLICAAVLMYPLHAYCCLMQLLVISEVLTQIIKCISVPVCISNCFILCYYKIKERREGSLI